MELTLILGQGDLALLLAMAGPDEAKQSEWCVKQLRKALNRQPDGAVVREFEDFWYVYPRKEGKGAARTAYVRARQKVDAGTVLRGLAAYSIARRDSERKFIAMPATWLNQERWSDELVLKQVEPKSDPHYAERSKLEHYLKTGRWLGRGDPMSLPIALLKDYREQFAAKGVKLPW